MKGALLLTVILAGLVAVQGDWEMDKVYKYEVKAKETKYSSQSGEEPTGLYSRYHLTLRPYSDDVIIGQITQAEFARAKPQRYRDENQDYSDSCDGNFENWPLSKPFKINLRNGVIQSMGVDNSLSTFEVNQLKLIMNQFQVDMNSQNVNSYSENRSSQEGSNTAYKTMESAGHSETTYDISPIADYLVKLHPEWIPLPELNEENGEFIEIVKTKDSANGKRHVFAAASNYLYEKGVKENDMSITESQRIVVSGSVHHFTIQSGLTATKLMYRPRNTPLIAVYVNSTLESVESASERPLNLPNNLKIVENLDYDFNPKMNDEYQPAKMNDEYQPAKMNDEYQPAKIYEYQPVQPRVFPRGVGTEYRYTISCWRGLVLPDVACLSDFGKEWKATGKVRVCGFLGLGLQYECQQE